MLTNFQLVKKLPAFYGTGRFFAALRRVIPVVLVKNIRKQLCMDMTVIT
jgi:hypothetical protein